MEQTISLRYMRTVQQLEKKTEEVDQLLKDAKSLDYDNQLLKQRNDEMARALERMAQADKQRDEEVALLESHVRRQQQKLQQYIDAEAQQQRQASQASTPAVVAATPVLSIPVAVALPASAPIPTERERKERRLPKSPTVRASNSKSGPEPVSMPVAVPTLPPAPTPVVDPKELIEVQKRLLDSETGRISVAKDLEVALQDGSRIKREFAELQQSVADLKYQLQVRDDAMRDAARREEGMKSTLRHLNQRHVTAALESREMEEIEAKALEGLRSELLVLEGENDRLKISLQEERQRYRDAKGEFEKSSQLLNRQKSLFDAHQKISVEEIQALTMQLESVLVDMKGAMDRNHKQGAEILRLQSQIQKQEDAAGRLASQLQIQSAHGGPVNISGEAGGAARFVDPEPVVQSRGDDDAGAHARTIRELLSRIDVLHKERDDAVGAQVTASQVIADQRQQIASLEGAADGLRVQLAALQAFANEKEAVNDLRREKEAMQGDEIRRLNGALAHSTAELAISRTADPTYDPRYELSIKKVELDALRDVAAKCLLSSTSTYRVVEAIGAKAGAVPDAIQQPDAAPLLSDGHIRSIYNDVIGSQITLLHTAAMAKGILRNRVAGEAAAAHQSRVAPLAPSSPSVSRAITGAHTPAPTPVGLRGAATRSQYSEGLSLKEVINDYRRTSPRRAATLDSSGAAMAYGLRDPMHMAQWELRRVSLLDDSRSGMVRM